MATSSTVVVAVFYLKVFDNVKPLYDVLVWMKHHMGEKYLKPEAGFSRKPPL